MAHHKQDLIDKLLDGEGEEGDHSLREQSLKRALGKEPPRTLTPWEWEQYYAEHGVPASHRPDKAADGDGKRSRWWHRLFGDN